MAVLPPFQSLLFVPGSRPERFAGALASGADLVCVDLEDAVGPADKDSARTATLAALGDPRLGLRINGLRTKHSFADLLALDAAKTKPPFVMVPMVESAVEPEIVNAALGPDIPLMPLIETVAGVREARAIAHAPGVAGIMLGGADFSGQLGTTLNWDALYAARAAIVMACADARIPAIDAPWLALDDLDGLAAEAVRIKAMGFAARALVHPKHVATLHGVMRPTAEQIAEAHEAEAAYAEGGEAAVRFKGKMLEAPVMARYRRILALGNLSA